MIEGAETFAALENAIQNARHSVFMAYWSFDPGMPTQRASAQGDDKTWGGLMANAARRGVDVRIILADFDPVFTGTLHETATAAYRSCITLSNRLEVEGQTMQVILSRHPAEVGSTIRLLGAPITRKRLRRFADVLNDLSRDQDGARALERLANLPGLWNWLTPAKRGLKPTFGAPQVFPAVHHEKLCVIDGQTAFIGGVDIERKRHDTKRHSSEQAWHDVACRVEGPIVDELDRHFRGRWNTELKRFRNWLSGLTPPANVTPLASCRDLRSLPIPANSTQPPTPGVCSALHTRSRQSWAPWALGSQPETTDIADALQDVISGTRNLLYIENQYFRSLRVARWIVEQARKQPELEVIILLPLLPEALLTSNPDPATRHGHYLQMRALDLLRKSLGKRLGLFTLLRNGPPAAGAPAEACLHGSDLVYVHSKVLIADDREAIVGSANLNERSLQTDTETSMRWRDDATIGAFRRRLWAQHFRIENSQWTNSPYVPQWTERAEANAARPAGTRQGFVVPMPTDHIRHKARRSYLVPQRNA